MTQSEYLDKYRHCLAGMVLDAATQNARGEALSLFVRQILGKVDAMLMRQYVDLAPKSPVAVNGVQLRKEVSKP